MGQRGLCQGSRQIVTWILPKATTTRASWARLRATAEHHALLLAGGAETD